MSSSSNSEPSPSRTSSADPDDTWALIVDPQEAERQKLERIVRLNTVVIPRLRCVGFALVSLSVLLHNYFVFGSVDGEAWLRFNLVLAAYCAASWYLLHLFFDDLRRYVDLGVVFLVADLALDSVAIHASGSERSWLFFLAVFRVVDQAAISRRRALVFAHLAPLTYLSVVLYVIWIEARAIPLTPELAKAAVIYAGSLYTTLVASSADRRTRRMAGVIRLARRLVQELAQKTRALEASSRDLRESLEQQSRLADENASLYAAAERDRARQQQIFDSTSDGIIFVTRDGHVEAANVRAGDLLDFDPQSVIGVELARLVSRLYSVSGEDSFLATLRRLLDNPWAGGQGDLQQPAAGRILHWIAQPARDADGDVHGLTFTFQDVTPARELVQQLEAATRMVEEARGRTEDTSRIRAELFETLSRQMAPRVASMVECAHALGSDRSDEQIERLHDRARELESLIDDLALLTSIESRQLALDRRPFSLRALLASFDRSSDGNTDARQLGVDVDPRAPDQLHGDPRRLEQIITGALGVVDATHDHPATLRVGVISSFQDEVVLHFALDGRSRPGTLAGLGPSVSRRLVQMMRGDLWVETPAQDTVRVIFTAAFRVEETGDTTVSG